MATLRRRRLQLIGVMLVFLAPMVAAFVLHLVGWQPSTLRNNGILVRPPQDLSAQAPRVLSDGTFDWRDPQYRWTLLLLAGPDCAAACEQRLGEAQKIWALMTQKATRLRLAVVGVEPTAARRAAAPQVQFLASEAVALTALTPTGSDSVAAVVVDPGGLLMLRFAPGYDAALVRQDLSRLIR